MNNSGKSTLLSLVKRLLIILLSITNYQHCEVVKLAATPSCLGGGENGINF